MWQTHLTDHPEAKNQQTHAPEYERSLVLAAECEEGILASLACNPSSIFFFIFQCELVSGSVDVISFSAKQPHFPSTNPVVILSKALKLKEPPKRGSTKRGAGRSAKKCGTA